MSREEAVGRVKGLLCSGTFSLFSVSFARRRLSFAFSSLSSNVFLSPCYDGSSSVDFSHCRPLLPCFICHPFFLVDFCWRAPAECCSLTLCVTVLPMSLPSQRATLLGSMPAWGGAVLQEPPRFRFATHRVRHFFGKTFRLPWDLQLQD